MDRDTPQLEVARERLEVLLNKTEDMEYLSFELIVGSLFPTAYEEMKRLYHIGYMDGYKAASE